MGRRLNNAAAKTMLIAIQPPNRMPSLDMGFSPCKITTSAGLRFRLRWRAEACGTTPVLTGVIAADQRSSTVPPIFAHRFFKERNQIDHVPVNLN